MDENIEKIKGLLYGMTKFQRRRWFVLMVMDKHGQSFASIAAKHRMTTWTLAKAVNGKAPWSPRIILALQASLQIDLGTFLQDKEACKVIKVKR